MTNADIKDFPESIPDWREWHEVPAEATIPAGTPMWAALPSHYFTWYPKGNARSVTVHEGPLKYYTEKKIAVRELPDSSDSPIVVREYVYSGGRHVSCYEVALFDYVSAAWMLTGENGLLLRLASNDIVDWSRAEVTRREK